MELRKKLDKFGIRLEFIEMESKGCYISELSTMFINEKLTDEEMQRVIYHELKHALDHSEYIVLYRKSTPHIKMEAEANDYMIREIVKENGGIYNYTQLIEEFNIGMGKDAIFANL